MKDMAKFKKALNTEEV